MNKTYCDICKKEIQQRDSWHLKLEPRRIELPPKTIQFHEICIDCVNKIKDILR